MKINKILLGLITVLCLVSCKQDDKPIYSSTFFLQKNTIGLYNEAKVIYTFNKSKDQLYFNQTNNTFRIVADDSGNYLEVVFASPLPRIGEMVVASIKDGGLSKVQDMTDIQFEVMQKDGDVCWLWNQEAGLGLIIFYVN